MTFYLKFNTQEKAISELTSAGYTLSEYNDTFSSIGSGWGTVFQVQNPAAIDENGEPVVGIPAVYDGWFANVYDCELLPESLGAFEVPVPVTPYNVVA